MKKIMALAFVGFATFTSSSLLADTPKAPEGAEKAVGHCEKKEADGTAIDIEATDKADCKAKGGKWNKKAKDDHKHEH